MNIHRTIDGDWAECVTPDCSLKFHFDNLGLDEALTLPLVVLLPLFELLDPPEQTARTGTKRWTRDGRRHRDYDLPAVITRDGSCAWFQDGRHHRERGPAIIRSDGSQDYVLRGETYARAEWLRQLGRPLA